MRDENIISINETIIDKIKWHPDIYAIYRKLEEKK